MEAMAKETGEGVNFLLRGGQETRCTVTVLAGA